MSDIKSKPITQAYADGWDAAFGKRDPVRGRFVWDARAQRLVPAHEYVPDAPEPARVPVVTDRHYEGVRATDGTDIGSRAKRREYMHRHGLADADDFKGQWAKTAQARKAGTPLAEIRDTVGRIAWEQKEKARGRKR